MKVLIIEDEHHAQQKLISLLKELAPNFEIIAIIDNVDNAVKWLKNFTPDLIFSDIQLADGLSFDIYEQVQVDAPVIFTTAYDEYAIQAFKLNSIDYLLKPIMKNELQLALEKLNKQAAIFQPSLDSLQKMVQQLNQPQYKERFLVKLANQLKYIKANEIAYCFSEDSLLNIVTLDGKKYLYDHSVDQIYAKLNRNNFYRINRKIIVNIDAIDKIHKYSNSRLKIELIPSYNGEVIVSRDRVSEFKEWLDK